MTAYTSLINLMEKLMSKLIDKMLAEGDERLFPIITPEEVDPRHEDCFHSFYTRHSNGLLSQISDWAYREYKKKQDCTVYGLLKDDKFIKDQSLETSAALFAAGFSLNYDKMLIKRTDRGLIYQDNCQRLKLKWVFDEGIPLKERYIKLEVRNAELYVLLKLNKLIEMDPIVDLGLEWRSGYELRYSYGRVGLQAYDNFTSAEDVYRHYKLLKVMESISIE